MVRFHCCLYSICVSWVLITFLSCKPQNPVLDIEHMTDRYINNSKILPKHISPMPNDNRNAQTTWYQQEIENAWENHILQKPIANTPLFRTAVDYYLLHGTHNERVLVQYLLGVVHYQAGNVKTALYYMVTALHEGENTKGVAASKLKKIIHKDMNFITKKHYFTSTQIVTLKNTVLQNQFRHDADKSSKQLTLMKRLLLTFLLLFSLASVFLLITIHNYKKEISILLQEANGQYVETLEAYQKLQCEIKDLHSDKGKEETGIQLETLTHILQNFQEKDCIGAWCSTLADGIVISFHRLAAEGCKPTAANWDDLKVYTYSTYPNFAAWHIRHFADIEKKEAQICLLVKLGFIPSEMAILLVTSRQNIANIRKCLLKRYFEKDGIPADFDREIQTL